MRCRSYRKWWDALDRNLKLITVADALPKDFVLSTEPGAVNRPRIHFNTYEINYRTGELRLIKDLSCD